MMTRGYLEKSECCFAGVEATTFQWLVQMLRYHWREDIIFFSGDSGIIGKILVLLCRSRNYDLPMPSSDALPLKRWYYVFFNGDSGMLGKIRVLLCRSRTYSYDLPITTSETRGSRAKPSQHRKTNIFISFSGVNTEHLFQYKRVYTKIVPNYSPKGKDYFKALLN